MELHYYKKVREAEEYLTWEFVDYNVLVGGDVVGRDERGWEKKDIPMFTSGQEKEAARWFSMSNIEDLHFLEMEKQYCEMYVQNETTEIDRAQESNKMILNNPV